MGPLPAVSTGGFPVDCVLTEDILNLTVFVLVCRLLRVHVWSWKYLVGQRIVWIDLQAVSLCERKSARLVMPRSYRD